MLIMKKEFNPAANEENAGIISEKIRLEAEQQIADILNLAKKEAEILIEQAQKQAAAQKQKALRELENEIKTQEEKNLAALNLETKKIILQQKSALVEDIISAVKVQAESFRNLEDYKIFLKKCILQALSVVDDQNIDIFYSFKDESIFDHAFIGQLKDLAQKKIRKDLTLTFKKNDFEDIGIIAQSKDARLKYDNRFVSRLKRIYDDIYMELLKEIK
jgi:vacuolar-type H+-ATPase subunit E/Vma4